MKVLRIVFRFIVGLLVTVYGCYLLTSMPVVQRWAAASIQAGLENVLGTQVKIGRVEVSIFGYAQLDSVLVRDRLGYPMLFASRVGARLSLIPLLDRTVYLEHAQIYGLKAALRQERADSAWNIQFLVDALKGDSTGGDNPWLVKAGSIMLRRAQVMVDRVYQPVVTEGLDPNHIVLRHISLNACIDKIVGDTVDVSVSRMSVSGQNGLRVKNLEARFVKHGVVMSMPQFVLQMPSTVADVTASWDGGEWSVYTNRLCVDCEDFVFLDERLKGKGVVTGKLVASGDTLHCMVDTLILHHETFNLVTGAQVDFAPLLVTTRDTHLEADVPAVADFLSQPHFVPTYFHNGYKVSFDGNLCYGERLASVEGSIYSPDCSVLLEAKVSDKDRFVARVVSDDLELTSLNPNLKHILINADVSGSIKEKTWELHDSTSFFTYGGYTFNDIVLDVSMDDSLRFSASIDDRHLRGKVNGTLHPDARSLSIVADVPHVRPDALDGKNYYDITTYGGKLRADIIIPQDPMMTTGCVALRDLCRGGTVIADSIVLTSHRDSLHDIRCESSFMSAWLQTSDLRSLLLHRSDMALVAGVRLWDDTLLDSLFDVRLLLLDTLRVDLSGTEGPLMATLSFDSGKEERELHMEAILGYLRDSVWLDLSLLSPESYEGNGRIVAHTALRDSFGIGRIDATVHNLNVGYVLDIVNFHSVEFDGWASGDVEMYNRNGSPYIKGLLDVRKFTMNDAYMGNLDLLISFDTSDGRLGLDGMIVDVPQSHATHAWGYVVPGKRPGSGMDLYIDTRRINAAFVNDFTRGIFEEIEGRVSGTARVYGRFSEIELQGDLMVDTVCLGVPMLGARFQAKGDSVLLRPGVFRFPSVHINDGRVGHAVVSGELKHKHFDDIRYDFDIEADNLLGYSFSTFGEMPFYATAFATGHVALNGEPGRLNVNIACTPQRGTVFVYDTSTPTAANADFITYGCINSNEDEQELLSDEEEYASSSTDINLHFDLNITPEAHLKVITDAAAGDGLDLYGRGRITADYYNKGAFKMYGQYVLESGEYNLSISSFLHKQFKFRSGGTLTFSGPPLQGELNLQAVNQVGGVSLNDLSSRATFSSNSVRVDCIMNLDGRCEQPRVTFDFDLPNVNEDEKQMVRSLISTDEERNMQVLYLLGIGRFYNYDYQGAAGQGNLAMKSLLSSTLSSTLNNVIGNALGTSNWSFGTAIATGDIGWSDMDIEGLVSGRLFNNRLLLNGQFGYRDRTTTGSNFIGDFDLQWTLTRSGNVAIKAYSETNDRYFTKSSLTTQGVGLVLKKDFNRLSEIFRRNKNKNNTIRQ